MVPAMITVLTKSICGMLITMRSGKQDRNSIGMPGFATQGG